VKAWVITIPDHEYSQRSSAACRLSAGQYDIAVRIFNAVTPATVEAEMSLHGLQWTWANGNVSKATCPVTGLEHFPYRTQDIRRKMACAMSHYLLWLDCSEQDDDYLILEHDARFVRAMPEIQFHGACQINDPRRAGYRGAWHSDTMSRRHTAGVHPLTAKREAGSLVPDGFSGHSAYLVKPWAAQEFVNAYHRLGMWPNDATVCLQLFPWLEEYYPFVTIVDQRESTTQ
jgi:GR25 family glycosyltransferase involved in LPS biosynthesis